MPEQHIAVNKLRGNRLQVIAIPIRGAEAYSQIVSGRGVCKIEYHGTAGNDSFQNNTSIATTAKAGGGDDVMHGGSGK